MNLNNLKVNKYKEELPENTIKKLINTLNNLGIEMEEEWCADNEIGTYSLRIQVKGTTIGSNGKGVTRSYARASAYAEFFERMQNVKLQSNATFYNLLRNNKDEFLVFPDEKQISIYDWVKEGNIFYKLLIKELNLDGLNLDEIIKKIRVIQKVDYSLWGEKDRLLCLPYYSVVTKNIVNIPYFSGNIHYGSNGMCAGNTKYEAIVQGICEVIERHVQKRIIEESICLPDVPEAYLAKNLDIYEMYKKLKDSDIYNIYIKDCSLGKHYPAAALILIEKNTGNYGVKVGCNADYGIALERLFTEATQGAKIEDYARKTVFDFDNKYVHTAVNLLNGFRTGDSNYPYQIFSDKPDYEFMEPLDISDLSNEEICEYLCNLIISDGFDILVRDVTSMGFPTFHVIVPGLSEMKHPSSMDYEADHTRFHVENLLNHPALITKDNCRYVISVIDFYKNSLNVNKLRDLSGFMPDTMFPCKEHNLDNFYFASMCYVLLEDYENAYNVMKNINKLIFNSTGKKDMKYKRLETYLLGMKHLKNHALVISYLEKIYDKNICNQIDDLFREPNKVLINQYSDIDINSIRKGTCTSCPSYYGYERLNEIIKKEQKNNMIDQKILVNIFRFNKSKESNKNEGKDSCYCDSDRNSFVSIV